MTEIESDVALFESITALIQEQRRIESRERRDRERFPFRCVQLVAPLLGTELPSQDCFHQVLCHDLSPNGFSFLANKKPECSRLVVALGRIPSIKFFVAEIVRVMLTETPQGQRYRVGCRFLRRLESEDSQ